MFRSIIILISSCFLGLFAGGIVWANSGFVTGLNVAAAIFGLGFIIAFSMLFFIKQFSTADVFLPIPVSIIWCIILLPFHLSSGLFTAGTAIGSGFILSICLWMYKNGQMSKTWIIIPMIVYFYEMLPIAIPGPFDDAFAFGGSFVSLFIGRVVLGIKNHSEVLPDKSADKDILT